MTKYNAPTEEDEWVQPTMKDFKFACCDCGLVHDVDFRIARGRVQLRMRRNNRSTGQVRRHKRKIEQEDRLTVPSPERRRA